LPAGAIVSEKLARAMSPHRDPVGLTLETLGGSSYQIIGIAKDVNSAATDDPIVYVFNGWDRHQTFLMARFSGDSRTAADAFRSAVRGLRSDLLVMPRTLQSRIDDSLANMWRVVVLILVLGLVAMTLSVAGIYGVISFTVQQKTHELGIRMALGAQKTDIFREVLISGGRPVLLGLFAGLWLALAGDSAIRQIFLNAPFQLDAANPEVYLGSALVLASAALAAMFFPARRGARSDPMRALHYE
jgi:ABC-type antimicrobial peptide transport system permease subunit